MIRSLAFTLRTVIMTVFIAAVLLVAAVIAAVGIMMYGASIALWPPKRTSTGVTGLLLERVTKGRDRY